ncbi:MAG: hypothetical protein IJW79_03190 [Clostridia bacterium]|nr:hypothetical protein [Clostridia bacterium]
MNSSDVKIEKQNIASHCKEICGKTVKYTLSRVSENAYEISAFRETAEESAIFYCDFFQAAELLKVMENTDTLPENIKDIADDFACR